MMKERAQKNTNTKLHRIVVHVLSGILNVLTGVNFASIYRLQWGCGEGGYLTMFMLLCCRASKLWPTLLQVFVVRGDGNKLRRKRNHLIRLSLMYIHLNRCVCGCTCGFKLPCTGRWGQVDSTAQGYWSCSS